MKIAVTLILLSSYFSCLTNKVQSADTQSDVVVNYEAKDGEAIAYFASGCFWCVEAVFESVRGVSEVISGYSGGRESTANYDLVARGLTKHAEAVKIFYDPEVIDYATLVRVFYGSGDPTTLNRQGPDRGTQYRSSIFYQNEEELKIAKQITDELTAEGVFDDPIITEIVAFHAFYDAEDYHQDYERLNPNQPYIRSVSIPRLNRFKAKFPELLKDNVASH